MLGRRFACFVALACTIAAFASVSTPTTAAGAAAAANAPTGLSAWKLCGKRLQCALLRVPVDYAQPEGPQVGIAVVRMPATDTKHRLGSLVFNFGGPGDAGTTTLPGFARDMPAAVRA